MALFVPCHNTEINLCGGTEKRRSYSELRDDHIEEDQN